MDPRNLLPSRADPKERRTRKELEKKAGYGYTEPLLLAALGIGLVWNIENQVNKCCERKDAEAKRENDRVERQRRRKEDDLRRQEPPGYGPTLQHGSRRSDRDREARRRGSSRYVDEGYRRNASQHQDDRYRRAASRHPDDGRSPDSSRYSDGEFRRDSSRYPDDEYRSGGTEERRMDGYGRDYPEEYRGYRDQYRDYHNDYRYEDRRDGSVRRSSRRDSF